MKNIAFLLFLTMSHLTATANINVSNIQHAGGWCDDIQLQTEQNNNTLNIKFRELTFTANNNNRVHYFCNLSVPFTVPNGYFLNIKNLFRSKHVAITGQHDQMVTWITRRSMTVRGQRGLITLGEELTSKIIEPIIFRRENETLGSYKFGCGESALIRIEASETLTGDGEIKIENLNQFSDLQLVTEILPCQK